MTDVGSVVDQAASATPDEIAAIVAVIHAETLAFQNQDFDAWQKCWLHSDRTTDIYVSATAGLSAVRGWNAISSHMRKAFEEELIDRIVDFQQRDMQVTVTGKAAWVLYETSTKSESGDRTRCVNTVFLELHDGRWKMVYSSFVLRQDNDPDGLAVALDAKGQIVQPGPAALEALQSHPFLTVSHGRIRAHRREWDKPLQDAILQAARHHGWFETHKFARDTGGPANYPVILGHTDEGGVAVVHFSIQDCLTFIRLDADRILDRRLGLAKTVFRLSDGQLKIAHEIALGKSLKGAAEELGISANTARTHLSRLFEKTGVNTQAALVRLLLSVG